MTSKKKLIITGFENSEKKPVTNSAFFMIFVFYNGQDIDTIGRDKEGTVERVIMMQYCGKEKK